MIRSLAELTESLDDELAWRKRELTTLKFLLDRPRRHERRLLLRAGVCVLYAHWEGFVKAAARTYVSFVSTRGLRHRDLSANFVALALRTEISQAGQSERPTIHTALISKLIHGQSEPATLDSKAVLNAQSNLNADGLIEIYCLLGLCYKNYLTKTNLLDHRLLKNRNLVAHGRRVEIEPEDYSAMHDEVIQLLLDFRNDVENAAVMDDFRR